MASFGATAVWRVPWRPAPWQPLAPCSRREYGDTVAVLIILLVALSFDATPLRTHLPTSRRQVNEDWLGRYRGWVYGAGFGAQLGVGVATIVTTAAVYAAAIGALLTGSVWAGALLGALFGATRALALLPVRGADDVAGLTAIYRRVAAQERAARWLVVAAETVAIAVVVLVLA